MFIIKNIEIGQFGNKLLYYNNLVQVAFHFKMDYYSPRFNEDYIFNFKNFNIPKNESIDIDYNFLIKNKTNQIENKNFHLTPCMGNLFFEFDTLKTNELFKFKNELIPLNEKTPLVGVHFRGKDFHLWDPKAILPLDYYLESINQFSNVKFKLFTDDLSMSTYNQVKKYMDDEKIEYETGEVNNLTKDFISLSYCDAIISSPSTFSISAGFCGKENKKIIHSKIWVDYQIEKNDSFWIGFNNGGNHNYKKYKII